VPDYGVRIGNETYDQVPAESKIRPLRDVTIFQPLGWRPSTLIPVIWHGRPLRGKVLAIGPGTYPKRYNGRKGVRTASWDSKVFRPCEVKVGDEIELGGLELKGYLFQTFRWGSIECVMCREEDVTFVSNAPNLESHSPRSSAATA
jgi:hypothetical protein